MTITPMKRPLWRRVLTAPKAFWMYYSLLRMVSTRRAAAWTALECTFIGLRA